MAGRLHARLVGASSSYAKHSARAADSGSFVARVSSVSTLDGGATELFVAAGTLAGNKDGARGGGLLDQVSFHSVEAIVTANVSVSVSNAGGDVGLAPPKMTQSSFENAELAAITTRRLLSPWLPVRFAVSFEH